MGLRQLDLVAVALGMPMVSASETVAALQAAFEAKGKKYPFDKTAKFIVAAVREPGSTDADVRFAADWLKSRG
jgi:hypothetical protein